MRGQDSRPGQGAAAVPRADDPADQVGAERDWRVLPDARAVAGAAVECLRAAARDAIAARGCFRVVLAGGRTPEATYRLLAEREADWERWEIYLGDERCLPPEHAERNSGMIGRALLSRVPLDQARVHLIPAELGPEEGAQRYAPRVAAAVPFDLVLLGLGEDGHTASLFPGHPLDPEAWVVAVRGAPKPPPERVSLGRRSLRDARRLLVLATGADKREALRNWRAGRRLPIAQVCRGRRVTVLLDAAAASGPEP